MQKDNTLYNSKLTRKHPFIRKISETVYTLFLQSIGFILIINPKLPHQFQKIAHCFGIGGGTPDVVAQRIQRIGIVEGQQQTACHVVIWGATPTIGILENVQHAQELFGIVERIA